MSHCCQCKHWDEESLDDNVHGIAICNFKTGWVGGYGKHFTIARTRGDDTCPSFAAKMSGQVAPVGANMPPVSDGTSVSDVPGHRRS